MSNYVLKYARDNRVKYISHLDFIRTFHRAVRRANMKMSFSQGFNPHPVMTIAMPLSVGITSDSEYMKIGFDEDYTEQEIMDRLNESFPQGFKIVAVRKVDGKELDFKNLDRAVYTVEMECENIDKFNLDNFLSNQELNVMKKSKSGIKESDIRPYIFEMSIDEIDGNNMKMTMCIAAGNKYNLKVDSVIDAMEKYCDGFKVNFFATHRKSILAGNEELIK